MHWAAANVFQPTRTHVCVRLSNAPFGTPPSNTKPPCMHHIAMFHDECTFVRHIYHAYLSLDIRSNVWRYRPFLVLFWFVCFFFGAKNEQVVLCTVVSLIVLSLHSPFHKSPNIFGILCSPNEDFGRSNQPFRMRFRSTFQGSDYSIWATIHWKVLRKRIRKGWFGLPKSSFGKHKFVKRRFEPKAGIQEINTSHTIFCNHLANSVANKKLRDFEPTTLGM
jgi:hypothetical protein